MGFVDAVRTCFVKAFVVKGRAPRSEFWFFWLFCVLVNFALSFAMGLDAAGHPSSGVGVLGMVYLLFVLVTFVPGLTVAIRRLHDTGHSGWWYLIVLVPVVGALLFLYWMVIKGDADENAYGPNPLDDGNEPQDEAFAGDDMA